MLKLALIIPVASCMAMLGSPAQAGTNDPLTGTINGPLAQTIKGVTKTLPVADALNQVVTLPGYAENGLFSITQGKASARKMNDGSQDALSEIAKGVVKSLGLDFVFSGLDARCTTAPTGAVQGLTKIADGKLVGNGLAGAPSIPKQLPQGYRVPLGDPNVVVTLNKQVRDPMGGLTVTALTIDTAPGRVGNAPREIGIAHCAPAQQAPKAAPKGKVPEAPYERAAPQATHDPAAGLLGAPGTLVQSLTGGLTNLPGVLAGATAGVTGTATDTLSGVTNSLPGEAPRQVGTTVDHLTKGGLSGLFGGLPGLPGTLSSTGLPVLRGSAPTDI